MKTLVCEMCNSTNMVKQYGVFVCQDCGTKYSVEEAKKMMVEGRVDVSGSTVKVDNSNKLENLYTLARRAVQGGDWASAHAYYKSILPEDPNSWEAVFFAVCAQREGKVTDLTSYGIRMMNSIPQALELIKKNVPESQQYDAVKCVADCSKNYSSWMAENAEDRLQYNFRNNSTGDSPRWVDTLHVAADILYTVGTYTLFYFSAADDRYEKLITTSLESGMNLLNQYVLSSGYLIGYSKTKTKDKIQKYADKIKSYNASYQAPSASSGCYIATAVYGSYDCPQVWTLRRFRDDTLASSCLGRLFIRTYYAISPTLVKWFGDTPWFQTFWRTGLDKMIRHLQEKGVDATPYEDKAW